MHDKKEKFLQHKRDLLNKLHAKKEEHLSHLSDLKSHLHASKDKILDKVNAHFHHDKNSEHSVNVDGSAGLEYNHGLSGGDQSSITGENNIDIRFNEGVSGSHHLKTNRDHGNSDSASHNESHHGTNINAENIFLF